jgi:hypothetical protein
VQGLVKALHDFATVYCRGMDRVGKHAEAEPAGKGHHNGIFGTTEGLIAG